MLVSCPPHRFPCHYGIDFATRGELIAAQKSVDEIRDFIGLDSLDYMSIIKPGKGNPHTKRESLSCLF
jgi:amidophosphoribosyltransferase